MIHNDDGLLVKLLPSIFYDIIAIKVPNLFYY